MGSILEDVGAASEWMAEALQSSGYIADFTPRSLWEVDRFFVDNSTNGKPNKRGLLSESLGARLFGLGAYVGEVLRRELGGTWAGDDADPEAEINITLELPGGTVCWPVQRVMKRLRNGAEDGVAAYGSAFGLAVGEQPDPPRRGWRRR